ncbi:hypothetical protein [Cellulosimicrobium marinum]|nr:hypothetical protein [Cellulosimicrobium marinum]MCB7135803.1 hypothetical protein [Cellulosimicrobium marinum]
MAVPDRHAVAGRARAVGNWGTIFKNINRWSEQGVWARVLEKTQAPA